MPLPIIIPHNISKKGMCTMNKKLSLILFLLFYSQVQLSYGALLIEDDPARRFYMPRNRASVGQAYHRPGIGSVKIIKSPSSVASEDEVSRTVDQISYNEHFLWDTRTGLRSEVIRVIFSVIKTDPNTGYFTSGLEEMILPKLEERNYFPEIAHDDLYTHMSFPRTIFYGVDEDGNRYDAGVRIEPPIFHVIISEVSEDFGEPKIIGGIRKQTRRHTITYKRKGIDEGVYSTYYDAQDISIECVEGVDGLNYPIYENPNIVDVPMARPAAAVEPPPADEGGVAGE